VPYIYNGDTLLGKGTSEYTIDIVEKITTKVVAADTTQVKEFYKYGVKKG
jgi:hypothetical protein